MSGTEATGLISGQEAKRSTGSSLVRVGIILVLLVIAFIIGWFTSTRHESSDNGFEPFYGRPPVPAMNTMRKMVFLAFADNVTASQQATLVNQFDGLFNNCRLPDFRNLSEPGFPYIVSLESGMNNHSLYNHSHPNANFSIDFNLTHGWALRFETEFDRDYFVGRPFVTDYDPVNDQFKQALFPNLRPRTNDSTGIIIYDFIVTYAHPFMLQNNTANLIQHTMLLSFNFSNRTDALQTRASIVTTFNNLSFACVRPGTNQTYITSLESGYVNDIEGFNRGFEYGWVFYFSSPEDFRYFMHDDPAHQAARQFAETDVTFFFAFTMNVTNSFGPREEGFGPHHFGPHGPVPPPH